MSSIQQCADRFPTSSPRQAPLWQRLLTRFVEWQERSRQRHSLGQLSDSMLSDIGLSRADVDTEVRKPFWQG